MRSLLEHCAATALSSKLVARHKGFFSKIVVDAVSHLDDLLPLNMIGTKKIPGGALEVFLHFSCHFLYLISMYGLIFYPAAKYSAMCISK